MKTLLPTLLVVVSIASTPLLADDQQTDAEAVSIESLLDGLSDEAAPAPKPTAIEGEDLGEPPAADNPLASIGQQMRQVKHRIDGGDTASETQFMQKQIVSDLDKLLDQLNKKCQGGQCKNPSANPSPKPGAGKPKGGSQPGQKSNRPNAQGSEEGVRKAEDVAETAADSKASAREAWGHLPERLREQVQAAAFERFLPQYEEVIEAYYERLAEEQ